MASKIRQKTVIFMFWSAVIMYFAASCVSAGSSKLSKDKMEKIINGKTTKKEIAETLGEPEQILNLDKQGLENYLSRIDLSDAPQHGFAEDQYEV